MKTLLLLLFVHTCSLATAQIATRIYNGYKTYKGQIPYQALLIQLTFKDDIDFCGGSVISTSHVLTAAHCSYQTYHTNVSLGLIDSKDTPDEFFTVYSFDTFVHPQYNPANYQNDIAVLKLPREIRYSANIQPIALPRMSWASPSHFDGFIVVASGFGQTSDVSKGVQRELLHRRVQKMSNIDCAKVYRQVLPVTNNMICTHKRFALGGPCQGDSGGPLTVKDLLGTYLIGVVSWSSGNCSSKNPIVYANVAYFLPWIHEKTNIPIRP